MSSNSPVSFTNKINISNNSPYFFKFIIDDEEKDLHVLNNNIYLVQPALSENNALYILDVWNTEHYNIGSTTNELQGEIPFTRLFYNSATEISRQDIYRGDLKYLVLCYMSQNKKNYLAMLYWKSI